MTCVSCESYRRDARHAIRSECGVPEPLQGGISCIKIVTKAYLDRNIKRIVI